MSSTRALFSIIVLTLIAGFVALPQQVLNFKKPTLSLQFMGFSFTLPQEFRFGLDLAGGTHLTAEADMKGIPPSDHINALEATRHIIEKRINLYGVAEPLIQTAKSKDSFRLIIELPGLTNVAEALNLIGQTAQLEFRTLESPSPSPSLLGPFTQTTALSGKHLKRAFVSFSSQTRTPNPSVVIEFNPEGAKLIEEITKENLDKPLAIFLDQELLSAPIVRQVITGGEAVISGQFTPQEARSLAIQLNAGALPVPIQIIEQRTIGPSLGSASLQKSLAAGLIGAAAVAAFMLVNYRLKGLAADLSLLTYTALVLALIKLLPITLTLAGIAGFILSIGMAVDANILIFERIREEIKWGRPSSSAVNAGFSRAWPSIRDSNITSLISAAILYWFGAGLVKAFAATLALGILVSMFSAITVTRTYLKILMKN